MVRLFADLAEHWLMQSLPNWCPAAVFVYNSHQLQEAQLAELREVLVQTICGHQRDKAWPNLTGSSFSGSSRDLSHLLLPDP